MDRYCVALANDRFLVISAEQIRRITVGLGRGSAALATDADDPAIVRAVRALLPDQRAAAFAVALLRFGHKQDFESICRHTGLRQWQVWHSKRPSAARSRRTCRAEHRRPHSPVLER